MKNVKHIIIVSVLALYLVLPLVGTLLYSLAGKWSNTMLPESWTLSWYMSLFQDERFLEALSRSIFVIFSSVILSLVVMLLAIFAVAIYFPTKQKYLKIISMLPYGVPAVASAIGLINIYSSSAINIIGTPWILIGSYAIIIMPFVYQSIRNSMYTVNAMELIQAAELLGATKLRAVMTIVLPNIKKGILSACLLSIAMLFGEFAFANLLVGGRFETLQIYLYQQFNKNGHVTSAIVVSYYFIILVITALLLTFQDSHMDKNKGKVTKARLLKQQASFKKSVEGDVS